MIYRAIFFFSIATLMLQLFVLGCLVGVDTKIKGLDKRTTQLERTLESRGGK
jgi:hypothetical protein